MSEKLAAQLAERVVGSVIKSGVREDILDALLKAVQNTVREKCIEAFLTCIGSASLQRDREWLRQLQGEWSPKSGLKTATTPAEVEQEMRTWMQARISEVRAVAYREGFVDAFPTAIAQGTKFGWAAHEAGRDLEAALTASKKLKP